MPIYEFRCQSCQRRSSFLVRRADDPINPACPGCGSTDLVRLMSSFAYHKSEKARMEEAGEPGASPGLDYYKDPRNIGRWTEKRFQEMGMELPDKVQRMIDEAREGQLPESLKDLASATPDATYH